MSIKKGRVFDHTAVENLLASRADRISLEVALIGKHIDTSVYKILQS
jgi:hypothetical protein